jgi:hypothetical protein
LSLAARANAQRSGVWSATGSSRFSQSVRWESNPIRWRIRFRFTARIALPASFSGAMPKRMTTFSIRAVSSASPP